MVYILVQALLGQKTASVTPKFSARESEGHQDPVLRGYFSGAASDYVFSPSSVALHMAAGLGVRDVGQYETLSHVQEILGAEPSVSIYSCAVSYFSASFELASWSCNSLLRDFRGAGRPGTWISRRSAGRWGARFS